MVRQLSSLLGLAFLPSAVLSQAIQISSTPVNASSRIPESFVSFSIEFAFFPDYAGNLTSPNTLSYNLIKNIGALQGTDPYIRVGGSTQDYALYNSSLKVATNGTIDPARAADFPTTLYIGPSFFESYQTWPGVKFSHGFNLGDAGNNTEGWNSLLETVPVACKALRGKLYVWEYGNEPDMYSIMSAGPVRPSTWNETTYVAQWLEGTRAIKSQLEKHCPDMTNNKTYGYMGPSFVGVGSYTPLSPAVAWDDGLDTDEDIKLNSAHNYITGATSPGVTLQHTLMNHTSTANSVALLTDLRDKTAYTGVPFILGETNSLYNEGAPGLSNAFGAALWGVDFNLYCASQGIRRTHMHQGTNYRYAAWQPVETNISTQGTKPPYYGNIAVAAFLGDLVHNSVQVSHIPLTSPLEAAYAAYDNSVLKRIAVVNLRAWNYTVNGTSDVINPLPRPSQTYQFSVGAGLSNRTVGVQRLSANGSDALTGITWDGWSYNWELDNGRPVRLANVTTGERVPVINGVVSVVVEDSSAVILNLLQ